MTLSSLNSQTLLSLSYQWKQFLLHSQRFIKESFASLIIKKKKKSQFSCMITPSCMSNTRIKYCSSIGVDITGEQLLCSIPGRKTLPHKKKKKNCKILPIYIIKILENMCWGESSCYIKKERK